MKIALCLHGLSTGRNDKGDIVTHEKAHETIKQNILDINDTDIFIHSWNEDEDEIKKIKNSYKPKDFIFEKQVSFGSDENIKYHSIKSRWYSHKKSLELKGEYESKHNFKYDFVMVSRFDACYFTPFIFSEYDSNCFYSADDMNENDRETALNDVWFFGGSEIMDKFSDIYDNVDEFTKRGITLSNHCFAMSQLDEVGLRDKLKFTKRIGKDYQLARRL